MVKRLGSEGDCQRIRGTDSTDALDAMPGLEIGVYCSRQRPQLDGPGKSDRGRGSQSRRREEFGGAQLVYRVDDGYCAASDHRNDGPAVGF